MTTVNWPSFFPPECPPLESKDASEEVFRLVSSDPPSPSDFVSHAQRNAKKWGGNCEASGLSVFKAKSDVSRILRRVQGMANRNRAIGDLIASATLSPEAGKIRPTPRDGNSHYTWWAPDGFDHAAAFKVVT
jgi:hypothetical protein